MLSSGEHLDSLKQEGETGEERGSNSFKPIQRMPYLERTASIKYWGEEEEQVLCMPGRKLVQGKVMAVAKA